LRDSCSFSETLDCEHVGLPASTAVYTMLARAAAIIGRPINYRAVVSSFDATIRCVRAGLGVAIMPREILGMASSGQGGQGVQGVNMVPLTDAWARRQFAICFRDGSPLSPAARTLVDYLAGCAQAG